MNMLNKDVKMVKGQSLAVALIVFAVAVLIAMALLPGIQTSITCAALTGASASLAALLVIVFIVVLIFAGLRIAGLA